MPHDTPFIATIVAGLGLASVFGAIAHRLRIPRWPAICSSASWSSI